MNLLLKTHKYPGKYLFNKLKNSPFIKCHQHANKNLHIYIPKKKKFILNTFGITTPPNKLKSQQLLQHPKPA